MQMCFYKQQYYCIEIWETLLGPHRPVLHFSVWPADPRLGSVWTFDLQKHSLAKGPEFLLSAKSISVFILVQEPKRPKPSSLKVWTGFKVRILPLLRRRITRRWNGLFGSRLGQAVMRFGCSRLTSSKLESLALRRHGGGKRFWLLTEKGITGTILSRVFALSVGIGHFYDGAESHFFNLGWRSWTSVLCKHQTACMQHCFWSKTSQEAQV